MLALLYPPQNVLIEKYKVHINVLLNQIGCSSHFFQGMPTTLKKICIYKKGKERVANSVSLNPFKLGLLHLIHAFLFRIYHNPTPTPPKKRVNILT